MVECFQYLILHFNYYLCLIFKIVKNVVVLVLSVQLTFFKIIVICHNMNQDINYLFIAELNSIHYKV